MRTSLFCIPLLLGIAPSIHADVGLGYAWGEGMILQAGVPAEIHGFGKPSEKVAITFRGHTVAGEVDRFSKWKLTLPPGDAGGPFAMTVAGLNKIELKDVHVAKLRLASVCGDGMVLQRGAKAPIFGSAIPESKITITFRGKRYSTKSDREGAWRIDLEPGTAGGPFAMAIDGPAQIDLKEVYVGEVWVCSGQSNMNWTVIHTRDFHKLPLEKTNPMLRLVKYHGTGYAPNHPPGRFGGWQEAHKKAVLDFSGTGYYFGAALQEKLGLPVGLIHSAVDATSIVEWMPGRELRELKQGPVDVENHYLKQIRRMQPFAIRGIIWYQGESGMTKIPTPVGYHDQLAAMIRGWRTDWGQGDFPFLFVQLPRIGFGADQVHNGKLPTAEQKEIVGEWARRRDEQRRVLSMVPNTAMATYYEQTSGMLHPPEKMFAGQRLALAARSIVYGERIEHSGPLIASAKREGKEIILAFQHAEGLTGRDGAPRQIEIAGADGVFIPFSAKIVGPTIRLPLPVGDGPWAVRYAYREWPDGNLFNSAGLPASPFQIDVK